MATQYNYNGQPLLGLDQPLQNVGVGTAGGGAYSGSWVKPAFGAEDPMALNDPYINKLITGTQDKINTEKQNQIKMAQSPFNIADFPGYSGWSYDAALADYNATGGAGKRGNNTNSGNNPINSNPTNDKTVSKKGDTRATAILNDPTTTQDFLNSGMDMDQYLSLIDQEANNSLNFLNRQESAVTADRDTALANLEKQRATNKQTALTAKEDAQSAARRLYNELQMGYRQRFGGASSAGEAAQALTNAEQQRTMAGNERSYQNAITQVDTSADSAIASAQSEFRNQLLQISQNRTQVESEKLAARRQALSDLSNKVFQIQQQRETFKQNLQLMQEQARLQNQSNLSALSVNPTSSLTMSGVNTTASGNTGLTSAIGSINKTSSGISKNDDALLASKGIFPRQSLRDGRIMYSDGIAR